MFSKLGDVIFLDIGLDNLVIHIFTKVASYPISPLTNPSSAILSDLFPFCLIPSHLIAFQPISSHLSLLYLIILSHPILSHPFSFHSIPSHLISSHHISAHPISSHMLSSRLILYHSIPSCPIPSQFISSYSISSHLISSHPILSHPITCHPVSSRVVASPSGFESRLTLTQDKTLTIRLLFLLLKRVFTANFLVSICLSHSNHG